MLVLAVADTLNGSAPTAVAVRKEFGRARRSARIKDQVIHEYGDRFGAPAWVHISHGPRGRRRILAIGDWTGGSYRSYASLDCVVGEINGLRGELSNAKERISVLEATSSQLPKHSDLTRLDGRVTEVAKSVSEIKGEIRAGNRLLDNIHKVLLADRIGLDRFHGGWPKPEPGSPRLQPAGRTRRLGDPGVPDPSAGKGAQRRGVTLGAAALGHVPVGDDPARVRPPAGGSRRRPSPALLLDPVGNASCSRKG